MRGQPHSSSFLHRDSSAGPWVGQLLVPIHKDKVHIVQCGVPGLGHLDPSSDSCKVPTLGGSLLVCEMVGCSRRPSIQVCNLVLSSLNLYLIKSRCERGKL